jgi:1-acyl-sn-glycerol-3-phosphate acyltransferase
VRLALPNTLWLWRIGASSCISSDVKSRSIATAEDGVGVRVAQAANRVFCRGYHQLSVLSPDPLPLRGPAILVCNHISGLDPLLVQSACRRLIVWMMAAEYYQIKSLSWLFKMVRAIPVDRSGRDLAATRAALRALSQGHILGIFPEGRIEPDHDLLPFQTGVALMAIKTAVPVYPAYLDGTQRGKEMVEAVAGPNHARLRFGPAVDFDRHSTSKESLESATAQIRRAVAILKARTDAMHVAGFGFRAQNGRSQGASIG